MKALLMFAVTVSLSLVSAQQVLAQANEVKPTVHYMETDTDANGRFVVPHGLTATDVGGGPKIVGAIVSVQHANRSWYPVYAAFGGSRVAWNTKNVSGVFSDFGNRPVRILLFSAFVGRRAMVRDPADRQATPIPIP